MRDRKCEDAVSDRVLITDFSDVSLVHADRSVPIDVVQGTVHIAGNAMPKTCFRSEYDRSLSKFSSDFFYKKLKIRCSGRRSHPERFLYRRIRTSRIGGWMAKYYSLWIEPTGLYRLNSFRIAFHLLVHRPFLSCRENGGSALLIFELTRTAVNIQG